MSNFTLPPAPTEEEISKAHEILYNNGVRLRYEVAGEAYVNRNLGVADSDPEFMKPMQELLTEAGWGNVWARPGLSRKQRSLQNIAMLCAINRSAELGVHVRGAVNNGATKLEIRETLLQVAIYCGMPSGIEGHKVAKRVMDEIEQETGKKIPSGTA
jgi:4-carboxymuconolactone decarboxylase